MITEPCKFEHAQCHPKFNSLIPNDQDDYICVCEQGYRLGKLNYLFCTLLIDFLLKFKEKDKDKDICSPIFCELPSLNKCEQECHHDQTKGYTCSCNTAFYELQGDHACKSNGKECKCPAGSFCGQSKTDCKCKLGYDLILNPDGKAKACEPSSKLNLMKNSVYNVN